MGNQIIVFTQTHNSEKTIERTIESVLNQTHTDFKYYIYDNNSEDKTKELLQKCAKEDRRITPVFTPNNEKWMLIDFLKNNINEFSEDDFFIQLDADDEYKPDCFEKMINFQKANDLDIVACCSAFIDGVTGKDISQKELYSDLIVEKSGFSDYFVDYFDYYRDSWGKLFTFSVLKKLDLKAFDETIQNGSLSFVSMSALGLSNRIGVLKERLHNYYKYPSSTERTHPRFNSYELYSYYFDYLTKKCGHITDRNRLFLYNKFISSIDGKLTIALRLLNKYDTVDIETIIKMLYNPLVLEIIREKSDSETKERIHSLLTKFTDGIIEAYQN
jgi:glycosyltransferase involved in cell wall biosynthesis